jgi:hypothetical protein
MPTEEKVVRYALTHKDLFAFNFRALLRSRMIQFMIILVILFLTYTTFNAPIPKGRPEPGMPVRLLTTLIVDITMLAAMFGFLILSLLLLIWTKRFKGLIGQHELTLTNAGLVSKSADSEAKRKWDGIFRLTSTKNYLFLYVNETMAMIVPKRYFASPAEAQSFEQMIRERMKAN